MNTKISKAVILNKGTISWFSKGSLHSPELPCLLNRPFLDYQLEALRKNGITEIHMLLVGSASHSEYDVEGLTIHRQDEFKGTAGALTPLRALLKDQPFIILNASTYINEHIIKSILSKLEAYSKNWAGTFAIFESPSDLQYSETINISKDGSIHSIYRSHRSQNRRSNKGLAGVYLLSPKCLDYIPDNIFFDLKEQLLPLLIKEGFRINAYQLGDSCLILNTNTYLRLQFQLLRDTQERQHLDPEEIKETSQPISPILHGNVKIVGNVVFGKNCIVENGATLVGPVLFGDNCRISNDATIIGPAVIGCGCEFGSHAWLQASVLHDNVAIGKHAEVRHSLLGKDHQVTATDSRYCVDALIDPLSPERDKSLMDHEMPQMLQHYDTLAHSYTLAKYQIKKRIFDIVLASTILIMTLPIWVMIAIAIRLESRGPVFYWQRRCGIHGKEFPMLKFRTMQPNAHQLQDELRHKLNEVDGPVFKMSNDPRLTKVGRFLRKTSLDELPQLINVIMGDMSCVGPRPLAIKEMTFNPHWRDLRLMVKPGLTGLWQVHSRVDPRFHAWIEKDIEYVRNQSIRRDIQILLSTIKSALQGV